MRALQRCGAHPFLTIPRLRTVLRVWIITDRRRVSFMGIDSVRVTGISARSQQVPGPKGGPITSTVLRIGDEDEPDESDEEREPLLASSSALDAPSMMYQGWKPATAGRLQTSYKKTPLTTGCSNNINGPVR